MRSSTLESEDYKTRLCRNFSSTGKCPYNHKCFFAHGPEELRSTIRQKDPVKGHKKTESGFLPKKNAGKHKKAVAPNVKSSSKTEKKWEAVSSSKGNAFSSLLNYSDSSSSDGSDIEKQSSLSSASGAAKAVAAPRSSSKPVWLVCYNCREEGHIKYAPACAIFT